jgi:hypothetical protein
MASKNHSKTAVSPELPELESALSTVSWECLKQTFIRLYVPEHALYEIETIHPRSRRMYYALEYWINRNVDVSWEKLAEALECCDQMAVARKIREEYLDDAYHSPPPFTLQHASPVWDERGITDPAPVSTSPAPRSRDGSSRDQHTHVSTAHGISHSGSRLRPSPRLRDTPTLAQLWRLSTPYGEDIRIIKSVSGKWRDVALEMDFDPVGETVTVIDRDSTTMEERCEETFRRWLRGQGSKQPPTWETLLEILRNCGFGRLSTKIETALNFR